MINPHQPRDIPQILLSVLFLALIIISCLWVVQPFILSFAWAGTVVIATWPVLLRLQRVLFGKRMLAVLAMTLLLFLLFVIPIALLVNSLVDNSVPLIKLISSGNVTLPDFAWLNSVPLVAISCTPAGTACWIWAARRLWPKFAPILAPPPAGLSVRRRTSASCWSTAV
jgi:predicted PurR-regulated permease PerM